MYHDILDLTSLEEVVRFFVAYAFGPPTRLCHFRIDALRYPCDHFASIVWKMHLFSGLDQLDV
jgi:hypothetical protein